MPKIAGVLHVERRIDRRYGVELRVQYAWDGRILDGSSLDLSRTGMRLQTEVDLGVDNELITYFRLPDEVKMHQVEAVVMWVAPSERILGLHECGLRFIRGPEESFAALQRIIDSLAEAEMPVAEEVDVVELLPRQMAKPPWSPQELNDALAPRPAGQADDERRAQRHLDEGRRLLRAGQTAPALTALREAAQLSPKSIEILETLGEALYRHGDVAGAAAVFDRALQLRQQ